MSGADPAKALAALRDAERFLYVCRETYARELEEARRQREDDIRVLVGSAARALAGRENPDDGVVAQQELREAIEAIGRATRLIAEDTPPWTALVGALRADDVELAFLDRVEALQRAVHSAYAELHAAAPDQPALQVWGHDEEDRSIARAAGAGLRPVHFVVGGLSIAYMIYFLFLA
jgi:hypothetical protein